MEFKAIKDADATADAKVSFVIADPYSASLNEYERLASGDPCWLVFEEHNGGVKIGVAENADADKKVTFEVSRYDGGGSLTFVVPFVTCSNAFRSLLAWKQNQ